MPRQPAAALPAFLNGLDAHFADGDASSAARYHFLTDTLLYPLTEVIFERAYHETLHRTMLLLYGELPGIVFDVVRQLAGVSYSLLFMHRVIATSPRLASPAIKRYQRNIKQRFDVLEELIDLLWKPTVPLSELYTLRYATIHGVDIEPVLGALEEEWGPRMGAAWSVLAGIEDDELYQTVVTYCLTNGGRVDGTLVADDALDRLFALAPHLAEPSIRAYLDEQLAAAREAALALVEWVRERILAGDGPMGPEVYDRIGYAPAVMHRTARYALGVGIPAGTTEPTTEAVATLMNSFISFQYNWERKIHNAVVDGTMRRGLKEEGVRLGATYDPDEIWKRAVALEAVRTAWKDKRTPKCPFRGWRLVSSDDTPIRCDARCPIRDVMPKNSEFCRSH